MDNPEDSGSERNDVVAKSWCHPSHMAHRGLALLFMCFITFGCSFCYDNPGALADSFKDDAKLNTSQLALLYAVYAWPNIIMCFIGGYLIDRYFGIRLGTVIFMIILFIGAVVFALGAYVNTFWVMVIGRFVFGIGGESLQVATNNYVVLWFKGKELNLMFGLQMSFSRIGSTVNFWVMEYLYRWVTTYYAGYKGLGVTLLIASLTCLASLICSLILGCMDHRAENLLKRHQPNASDEPLRLTDVRHLKSEFWLTNLVCVMYLLAIFPFISLAKLFFERKFAYDPIEANNVNSISILLSAVLSPFCGILIDRTGRNLSWVIGGILLTVASHAMLAFTFFSPYIGVMLLGIGFSIVASALCPLIALIVPEKQLGTAYGINQALQNLGLAVVTLLAGTIVDNFGYFMLEILFLTCLFISLVAGIMLYWVDSANGSLNLSPAQRDSVKLEFEQDESTHLLRDDEQSHVRNNGSISEVLRTDLTDVLENR